jgi:hypothetical protein
VGGEAPGVVGCEGGGVADGRRRRAVGVQHHGPVGGAGAVGVL